MKTNFLINKNLKINLISDLIRVRSISKTLIRMFCFVLKRPYLKLTSRFLLKKLESKSDILLVYDLFVSPSTYGDFILILLLARFFLVLDKNVTLLVINDKLRSTNFNPDTSLPYATTLKFLKEKRILSEFFCGKFKSNFSYKEHDWINASKLINSFKKSKDNYVYKGNKAINRESLYYSNFENIVNFTALLPTELLDDFLLDNKDYQDYCLPKLISSDPYIVFNVRLNPFNRIQDNTSDEIFENVVFQIEKNYPFHKLLIVSDEVGCKYFSKLANKKSINCLFSKDLIPDGKFIDDALMVLGADYYIQIKGGGITLIREFSKKPYFINHSLIWMQYSFNKVYSFQGVNQILKIRRQKGGVKIPIIKI